MAEVIIPRFGWITPDFRTTRQNAAHAAALAEMPKFMIIGRSNYGTGQALLYKLWDHPDTVKALGYAYPGNHQIGGCCVGAGGGNAMFTLLAGDCITRKDPEQIVVPFWLLTYGRSRFYMGETTPGEGSMGSTFAKAMREDGTVSALADALPAFKNSDGLIWGEEAELSWSDGDARQTMSLLAESQKHLVKTTAAATGADNVRDGLVNGYPVTCASDWGGHMECPTRGTPPVLLNEHVATWPHQQSVQAWWDHPSLGEIFYIMNQWGLNPHGKDPAGGTPGGYWILRKEMDWMCTNGEVFIISGFDGFPSREVPWDWENRIFG